MRRDHGLENCFEKRDVCVCGPSLRPEHCCVETRENYLSREINIRLNKFPQRQTGVVNLNLPTVPFADEPESVIFSNRWLWGYLVIRWKHLQAFVSPFEIAVEKKKLGNTFENSSDVRERFEFSHSWPDKPHLGSKLLFQERSIWYNRYRDTFYARLLLTVSCNEFIAFA